MLKKIAVVALALFLFAGAASAQYFGGLSASTYKINSLWPESFSSISGSVTVKMSNTGGVRQFRDISAVLYKGGKPFMRGTCSDVTVPSGESEVAFSGRAQLDGVSIFSVFGSALMTDLSTYTADVFFTAVDADGTATPVARKGVPVGNYLKK
ncbi:MAG: hypothetical protein IKP46_08825 [Bacteroidales bacterium]|nr:hypothetical protein [Bacteroidales bacterium]